ncbi:hypothetical protein FXO38_09248 [Capsicum annuum]|nr:hypothetical protein FXO38_09248 [Capsicum annuum]
MEDFKGEVIELFRLPMEEKKKLWQQKDNHEGFGQLFVVSEEHKLDWSDMFYITTLPPHIRQMDLFQRLPSKLKCLSLHSLSHRGLPSPESYHIDLSNDAKVLNKINYVGPFLN